MNLFEMYSKSAAIAELMKIENFDKMEATLFHMFVTIEAQKPTNSIDRNKYQDTIVDIVNQINTWGMVGALDDFEGIYGKDLLNLAKDKASKMLQGSVTTDSALARLLGIDDMDSADAGVKSDYVVIDKLLRGQVVTQPVALQRAYAKMNELFVLAQNPRNVQDIKKVYGSLEVERALAKMQQSDVKRRGEIKKVSNTKASKEFGPIQDISRVFEIPKPSAAAMHQRLNTPSTRKQAIAFLSSKYKPADLLSMLSSVYGEQAANRMLGESAGDRFPDEKEPPKSVRNQWRRTNTPNKKIDLGDIDDYDQYNDQYDKEDGDLRGVDVSDPIRPEEDNSWSPALADMYSDKGTGITHAYSDELYKEDPRHYDGRGFEAGPVQPKIKEVDKKYIEKLLYINASGGMSNRDRETFNIWYKQQTPEYKESLLRNFEKLNNLRYVRGE